MTTMSRNPWPVVVLIAALVLAACGGDGSSDVQGSRDAPPARGARSDGTPAVVETARTDEGTVLVDGDGFALYTFTSDGEPVPCNEACAAAWPPLLAPSSGADVAADESLRGLGVVSTDGEMQVALNGLPLYRYVGDQEPGEVNGDGIVSFGGTWRVARPPDNGSTRATTSAEDSTTPRS